MDDISLNPFSDMYAFAGNSGNDDTSSSNANENPQNTKKKLEAWESESAFGTFNKPPKLTAIEEYNRWSKKFEDWLMAFAFASWKSLENGYIHGDKSGETLSSA
ncbi:hypothetical protein Hdeb2414_s0001g00015031 [Helianthus debilis subsp. tardiflorus]